MAEVSVSDLAHELVNLQEATETGVSTSFDVKVFNGAAVVHFLSPTTGIRTLKTMLLMFLYLIAAASLRKEVGLSGTAMSKAAANILQER